MEFVLRYLAAYGVYCTTYDLGTPIKRNIVEWNLWYNAAVTVESAM